MGKLRDIYARLNNPDNISYEEFLEREMADVLRRHTDTIKSAIALIQTVRTHVNVHEDYKNLETATSILFNLLRDVWLVDQEIDQDE
jgi:hypothetical protein